MMAAVGRTPTSRGKLCASWRGSAIATSKTQASVNLSRVGRISAAQSAAAVVAAGYASLTRRTRVSGERPTGCVHRPPVPSAATRGFDLAPERQTIDRGDFACGEPLELADLGIDASHDLLRYGCCRLRRGGIGHGNLADQGQERVVQSCGVAQHVASRL